MKLLDKLLKYFFQIQLKFGAEKEMDSSALYVITKGYSHYRKLPDLIIKVNSMILIKAYTLIKSRLRIYYTLQI